MSNDPLKVHLDQVLEFLTSIGLDPVDANELKSVHIDPGVITVTRNRLNERARPFVVGEPPDDRVATEVTTIAIDYTRDSA